MISLKKYIESNSDQIAKSALERYRSTLGTIGASGVLACPPVGTALEESLRNLSTQLESAPSPDSIEQTGTQVDGELEKWGKQAAEYYQERTGELKEIMIILAHTAELVGNRDERYAGQFHQFTARLESMANLHDLAEIRTSLVKSASDLRTCAEHMLEESRESLSEMRRNVTKYEERVEEAERRASRDALTGLETRARVEEYLAKRLQSPLGFSLIVVDLNGFKQINDTHGHAAGDQVLKQFAVELKSAFRANDMVARWGGDEFVVVVDGAEDQAESCLDRLRKWVLGDYTVQAQGQAVKVSVRAALGLAIAQPDDTPQSLFNRGDEAMYADKHRRARGVK